MVKGYWQIPPMHCSPTGQHAVGTPPTVQTRSSGQHVPPPAVQTVPAGQQTSLGTQTRGMGQQASPGPQPSPSWQHTCFPAQSNSGRQHTPSLAAQTVPPSHVQSMCPPQPSSTTRPQRPPQSSLCDFGAQPRSVGAVGSGSCRFGRLRSRRRLSRLPCLRFRLRRRRPPPPPTMAVDPLAATPNCTASRPGIEAKGRSRPTRAATRPPIARRRDRLALRVLASRSKSSGSTRTSTIPSLQPPGAHEEELQCTCPALPGGNSLGAIRGFRCATECWTHHANQDLTSASTSVACKPLERSRQDRPRVLGCWPVRDAADARLTST